MNKIIEVKDVTKVFKRTIKKKGLKGAVESLFKPQFKEKVAVDHLNFTIHKGEIVGFIGANGAGKSTTIKMMTGILYPSSGEIIVDGLVPYQERRTSAKKMGVVFGQRSQLIWDIALEESFTLQKQIYGMDDITFKERLAFFVKELELEELLRVPIRQMSLGQKMRCELAAAFLHNPKIVYLDEPTIGLDVKIKEVIRNFIKKINEQDQTTIILTTHDMQDIEALVNHVIIIDQGKKLYDGDIDKLSKQFGSHKMVILEIEDSQLIIPTLVEKYVSVHKEKDKYHIEFSLDDIKTPDLISHLFAHNSIIDFTVNDQSIESIVKVIYEKKEVISNA